MGIILKNRRRFSIVIEDRKYNQWLVLLVALLFLVQGCKDKGEEVFDVPRETREINDFIWQNMDTYYFWRDEMPRNIDRRQEADPKAYFDKLVYQPEDIWSFITDDVQSLINRLNGIELTFGHQFRLFKLANTDAVFGVVRYVIPESPADRADMRRGDIFYKVNGVALDTTNYADLLYNKTNYTLTYGQIDGSAIYDTGREVTLIAEVVQENPILLDTMYEIEGTKIGYLVYNQFIPAFETILSKVFAGFLNNGIEELVLDLRYNPGGSTNTAQKLASFIAPQSAVSSQSTFAQFFWNDILTDYLMEREGPDSPNLVSKFTPSNWNLDLSRIYILVSSNTASASELIINGLDPYMEVIVIGPDNTSGKYTGSLTLYDEDEEHTWGIQPIVLKSANANGITDYKNGFAPSYLVEDDYTAPLGSLEEDMLLQAAALITGIPGPARIAPMLFTEIYREISSGGNQPIELKQRMYIELD